MKKSLFYYTVTVLLISSTFAYSQIKTEYFSNKKEFERVVRLPKDFSPIETRTLPNFDLTKIINEDKRNSNGNRPFRFGKGFNVNIEVQYEDWKKVIDGRIWSIEFFSKGAKSINFVFEKLHLIEGAELYVFNDTGTVVYGPVTHLDNKETGVFLTDLVQGERVTIYIHEPDMDSKSSSLIIKRVVHGYKGIGKMTNGSPGASENCNNNIECFPAWDLHSDAVGLILLSNGEEWCSGSLVMSADQSFQPFFLSAFHCIDTDSNGAIAVAERDNAEDWMFKFQFKYSNCSGTTPGLSYAYNGSTFRAGWFNTDFLLMELNNSPIGNNQVSWAGWDRSANIPDSGAGIHHPAGDVMKISLDNNQFQTSSWNGVNNHWLLSYDDGVVQHGSSGSPIFNQNNRIVGQLHGNQNYNENQTYCNQPSAEYGMLSVSWAGGGTNETRLSNWLDPCNSGNITTNTSRPPSIVGPDFVCSSGASFSVNNLPTGATITWTNSTILSRISAQDSNPGIFSANGQGNGWLQAEIALPNGCGNNIIVRKDVWTGNPNEVTKLSHVSFGCTMGEIFAKTALGAEQYEWQVYGAKIVAPGTGTTYIGEESSIFVDPDDGNYDFTVKVRAINACGYSNWYSKTIPMDCSGGPTPLSTSPEVDNDASETIVAYPNPANDQITVIVRGDYEYTGTRPTGIHAIRVLDQNSIERQYYTFKQNKTVQTIDISYLTSGLNFLLVYTDAGVITKKILVR